jgi:uracil phosphoribosyltransferase
MEKNSQEIEMETTLIATHLNMLQKEKIIIITILEADQGQMKMIRKNSTNSGKRTFKIKIQRKNL